MVGQQAVNAYRTAQKQNEIHPVKLVHMLYERVLVHLDLAEKGIRENNPRLRGENLGKAIAIVAELNASIRSEDNSEAAQFLRGLYSSILMELPKVSISGDLKTLKLAAKYLCQLKELWEQTAMQEADLDHHVKESPPCGGTVTSLERNKDNSDYCQRVAVSGLSVSI